MVPGFLILGEQKLRLREASWRDGETAGELVLQAEPGLVSREPGGMSKLCFEGASGS